MRFVKPPCRPWALSPCVRIVVASAWRNSNAFLVSRDHIGKKSKPEWGLNISYKNMKLLDDFLFTKNVKQL
jgi:nuclear transport factor 2 (NTF2) superfamily protein